MKTTREPLWRFEFYGPALPRNPLMAKQLRLSIMKNPLMFFLLFLIGCNPGPKGGEWYEHKGTRDRIHIVSVGKGADLKKDLQGMVDKMKGYRSPTVYFVRFDAEDSEKQCVEFEKHHPGLLWWEWHVISVDKLNRDYSIVKY